MVSFHNFVNALNAWGMESGISVYTVDKNLFICADFSGQRDLDIWISASAVVALESFLKEYGAIKIIARQDDIWTSQAIYLITLSEGIIQLDVGIGKIAVAFSSYCHLQSLDISPGITNLPKDVEIFRRGYKNYLRRLSTVELNMHHITAIYNSLATDEKRRMAQFFNIPVLRLDETFTREPSKTKLSSLFFRKAISDLFRSILKPVSFIKIIKSKLVLPTWPAPFGRKIRGAIITIIGTDGTGKSTTHKQLRSSLSNSGLKSKYVYMGRSRGSLIVPKNTQQKIDGAAKRIEGPKKLLKYMASWFYFVDYLIRFSKILFHTRILGTSIQCDRYYYDILLMESYSRIGYKLLEKLAPAPDLLIVLDCPVNILIERKAERSESEYERQREFYLSLATSAPYRFWAGSFDTSMYDTKTVVQSLRRLTIQACHSGYCYPNDLLK